MTDVIGRLFDRELHLRKATGALVALVIALSACTGPAPAVPSASASTPTSLTIGLNTNLTTLDPDSLTNIPAQSVAAHIMEPLIRQASNLDFVPALATSYDRPTPTTWRFKLRDGVKFHNGAAFSADDVVYSMNRIKDTTRSYVAATNASFFSNVDKTVKVDALTVDIMTKTPTAFLLTNLQRLLIIPQSAEAAGASWGTNPVGTGPFRFVKMTPGERLELQRNDDYWGPKPKISSLIIRPLVEDATRVAALQAGEVQVINSVPIDSLQSLKSNSKVKILSTPSSRTIGLVMRTQSGPLADVRVRKAIAHAIDKQALTRDVLAGTAQPANSPFAPGLLGRKEFADYTYDPALSRKLLAEAGYPNGIKIKYGIPLGNYLMDKQIGEALTGMLQKAGIDVTGYEEIEWAQFFPAATRDKKYELYLYGLGSIDPSFLVSFQTLPLYHDWTPAGVAGLVTAATAGPLDKSVAPLQQLQQMMWDDVPWVFLYYQPQILAVASGLDGVPARTDEYIDFREASYTGR